MTPLGIASIDRTRSIVSGGRDPGEGMAYDSQVPADRRRRGHIQSIQPRQGSISLLQRGSNRFNRMGLPPFLDLPPRSPVFRLGDPTTPRFGKLFALVGSRCGPRQVRNSGRFDIIRHIPTENVLREEQRSSRSERTSNQTEARRWDETEAWKSRPESLESASKLNKNLTGMH
jgi:hypothetical protein